MPKPTTDNLKPGESGVPLWITIMWSLGVIWMIGYVIFGLMSSPKAW